LRWSVAGKACNFSCHAAARGGAYGTKALLALPDRSARVAIIAELTFIALAIAWFVCALWT
jgi:hypothetical protein